MGTREEQRNRSRQRIVDAAVEVFSERGYQAGTTREIAARAETTQGLVTYHFGSKDGLWQAAIDELFVSFRTFGIERLKLANSDDAEDIARQLIADFVRIAAQHANLFRMLNHQGDASEARVGLVVEHHIRPLYDIFAAFCSAVDVRPEHIPNAFFIVAGSASMIFTSAHFAERLTGIDPTTEVEINRHAAFLARVLIPET
jgi:TetR/AcrR family transcriptional regulator